LRGSKLSLWDGGMRGLAFVSSPLLNGAAGNGQLSAASSIQNSTILMHACDWCAMPALCLLACIDIRPHQPQFTSYVRVILCALHGRRFATILDIAGLPPSSLPATAIDSVSQWSALSGGLRTGPRRTLLHHVSTSHRTGEGRLETATGSCTRRMPLSPAASFPCATPPRMAGAAPRL
jgi:hypothetical protein